METALLAIIVVTWLICGVLAYSGLFAYLQEMYPVRTEADCREQRRYPLFPALFGPIGLLTVALATRCFTDGFTFPSSRNMFSTHRLFSGVRRQKRRRDG